MRLVWASVEAIKEEASFEGVQYLDVAIDDGSPGAALVYTALLGYAKPGDRVILNTTAVDLKLGTGGIHFVTAIVDPEKMEGEIFHDPALAGGHIMKLRYSPHQRDVLSVEEEGSPFHEIMKEARYLEGTPVVACGLHSQVAAVAAAVKSKKPDTIVAYVMTDHASLSLKLSNLVHQLKENGLLDVAISTGQSYGGDLEAVSLHSGLLAAKHVASADVIIASCGPGIVGTGTPYGHGGVAQGEIVNAVAALQGTSIFCLRMSLADERKRHRGVSHHSTKAIFDVALAPTWIAVPHLDGLDETGEAKSTVERLTHGLRKREIHALSRVWTASANDKYDEEALRGIKLKTMGREYLSDPIFFEAAWAAGVLAAQKAS